jgi:hypothetical protein
VCTTEKVKSLSWSKFSTHGWVINFYARDLWPVPYNFLLNWKYLGKWKPFWRNHMNTTSVVCQFCLSKHVVYFFTAIGSEDIPFFHCSFVLCLSFASTSESRYIPTVLVQLIQKIWISKVLNSFTKRKLYKQGRQTTQFRVPPWKPDCLGAPGSSRVELIGVTPLIL